MKRILALAAAVLIPGALLAAPITIVFKSGDPYFGSPATSPIPFDVDGDTLINSNPYVLPGLPSISISASSTLNINGNPATAYISCEDNNSSGCDSGGLGVYTPLNDPLYRDEVDQVLATETLTINALTPGWYISEIKFKGLDGSVDPTCIRFVGCFGGSPEETAVINILGPAAGPYFHGGNSGNTYSFAVPTEFTSVNITTGGSSSQFQVKSVTLEEIPAAADTPEPGTYALMGAGLAAMALIRRRKA